MINLSERESWIYGYVHVVEEIKGVVVWDG